MTNAPPPPDFLFLRHGETVWNRAGRTQGQKDVDLNALGQRQAEEAAALLADAPITRIVASPLKRVRDTAGPVADRLGLSIEYDDGLQECGLGVKEGEPHGPWLDAYWAGQAHPDGAEPFDAFAARAWAAVRRAVDREGVLIVAHGGIWRAMMLFVEIEPRFAMPNGLPVRVRPSATVWRAEPLAPLRDGLSWGRAV